MFKRKYRNTLILIMLILVMFVLSCWVYLQHINNNIAENAAEYEVPDQFQDEPEARARFDAMMTAYQQAQTLSYESELKWKWGKFRYSVQLMKPNYFRLEGMDREGNEAGVIVGDGNDMWIFWRGIRPWYAVEEREDYLKTRTKGFMRMDAPPRKHSIKAEASRLAAFMGIPVIEPSFFHMCWDTMLNHIDAMRRIGKKRIDGRNCIGIEISFMEGQRSWYLWLSDQDNFPRGLKEVVRAGSNTIVTTEKYFNVRFNGELEEAAFKWTPPADWKEIILPGPEETALKVGQIAPEIALQSIDGEEIKLSGYRGSVVWLVVWKLGCPPYRAEMPVLERLYKENTHKGFVVLGVNFIDDKQIARDLLIKNNITFPNIVDSSDTAMEVMLGEYHGGNTPVNYIIGIDGRIVERWFGYDKNDMRGFKTVQELLGN